MGWSSATNIFDKTASALIEADYKWTGNTDPNSVDESIVINPLKALYYQMAYVNDWDTECESDYWEHPVIGKILGNDFEDGDD